MYIPEKVPKSKELIDDLKAEQAIDSVIQEANQQRTAYFEQQIMSELSRLVVSEDCLINHW